MFCIDPLKEENRKIYESLYLFTKETKRNQIKKNEYNNKNTKTNDKWKPNEIKTNKKEEIVKRGRNFILSLEEMSHIHTILKEYTKTSKVKQYNILVSNILSNYVFRNNLVKLLSIEINKIKSRNENKVNEIMVEKSLKLTIDDDGLTDEIVAKTNTIELNSDDYYGLQKLVKDLENIIDSKTVIPLLIFNRADIMNKIPYYINNIMNHMIVKYIDCDSYGVPNFTTSNLAMYYYPIYKLFEVSNIDSLVMKDCAILNLTDTDSSKIKQRLSKENGNIASGKAHIKILTHNSYVFELGTVTSIGVDNTYSYILNRIDELNYDIDTIRKTYLGMTLKEVGDQLLKYSRPLMHKGELASRYDNVVDIRHGANIRFDKITFQLVQKLRDQIIRYIKPGKRVFASPQKINLTIIGNKASGKSKFINLMIEKLAKTKLIQESDLKVSTVDSDSFNVWCEINDITVDKLDSDIKDYKIPTQLEMNEILENQKTGIMERYANKILEDNKVVDLKGYYKGLKTMRDEMRDIYMQYMLSEKKINMRQFLSLFVECENRPEITIVQLHNTYEQPAAPRHDVSMTIDNIWNTEIAILQRNEKGVQYNLAQLLLHDVYDELTSQLIQKSYPCEIYKAIDILFN